MADRTVTVRLQASVSDYMAKMSAAARATLDLEAKVASAKGTTAQGFQNIAHTAMFAGGAVAAGFVLAARSAAEFDAKMALVQTLAKASASDMAALRTQALNAGQAYGFTAGQVADAQAELVKAGISVKDILGGALVGALTLASAGQTDVASATEIAAAAMTQFQLSGKDVPHIADLLAAGADKALGSITDLGYGLSQVGTTAHQYGITIEETVGTLSALAEAGQTGSRGGTELNQMLLKLAAPGAKAAAEMKTLGINAYDAQGNFVGLAKFAGSLHDGLDGLSQADRNHAETVIFGSRAIKAANVLYAEGAAGIAEWTQKVNDSGFAELQATGKLNSLTGDWQKFTAAFQTAMIQAGQGSQGPLRQLVQDGTSLVRTWSDLPAPLRDVSESLVLVAGGAAFLGGAALILIPKIAATKVALAEMGTTGTRVAGVFGKGGALVAGLTLAVAAVSGIDEAMGGVTINADAMTAAVEKLGRTGLVSGEMTKAFGDNLSNLKSQLDLAGNGLDVFGFKFHGLQSFTHTGSDFSNAREAVNGLDQALAALVQDGHADEAAAAWQQVTEAAKAQGVSISDLVKKFPAYAGALAQSKESADQAGSGIDQYGNAVDKAAAAAARATAAANKYNDALKALTDPLFGMNQALQDLKAKQQAVVDAQNKYGKNSKQYRQALLDLASSAGNAEAAAHTLSAAVQSGSVTVGQAKGYLNDWVKAGILTKAQADVIAQSFQGLIGKAQDLAGTSPTIHVHADTSGANRALDAVRSRLTRLHGKTITVNTVNTTSHDNGGQGGHHLLTNADGGWIPGSGAARADDLLSWVSSGEFIVNANSARANGKLLEAINSGARISAIPGQRSAAASINATRPNVTYAPVINYPEPEPASESIPRVLRNAQFLNGGGWQ